MTYRQASPSDADAIFATWMRSRTQAMPYLPKLYNDAQVKRWIETVILRERDVWIAEKNERCVAFLALGPGQVEHLYVHPEFQHQGIGRSLLAIAKSLHSTLRLHVFQRNEGARRFYEREGFRLVELGDGSANEEKEPDALYEWKAPA